jgi:hypothetical protein
MERDMTETGGYYQSKQQQIYAQHNGNMVINSIFQQYYSALDR